MNHDALIEELCRTATPVRRPLPSAARALGAAIVSLALGWLMVGVHPSFANLNGTGNALGGLELAMTAIAGVAALLCAFEMSIAGRPARGLYLATGSFLAWLVVSLAGLSATGTPSGSLGDGLYCFRFLLVAGAPMMVLVVLMLRRTRTLRPGRTLLVAALGVASLSISLLACCHPFALSRVDFLMHTAAVACIVLLMVVPGRRWIGIAPVSGVRRSGVSGAG